VIHRERFSGPLGVNDREGWRFRDVIAEPPQPESGSLAANITRVDNGRMRRTASFSIDPGVRRTLRQMLRWTFGLSLVITLLAAAQTSCGDGSFDCCECTFMGPDCSDHFGPERIPNGITRSGCASLCAAARTCPLDRVTVNNGCPP
jgi:hypothetical protein